MMLPVVIALLQAQGLFSSANRHVEQGNHLFDAGKLEQALSEYDKAGKALPDEPGIRFNRGAALYGLGKFDEAQKEFLRATEAKDGQLKEGAFYNMGNSFFRMKRYKDAVEAYKRALGTNPRDARAKWNLEMALRQQEEEEKKKSAQNKDDKKNDQKKDDQNQQQKPPEQDQNKQAKNDQEKQKKPDHVPEPKDKPQEPQQAKEGPKDKPVEKQDAEAVLDALERGEKNLELEQARVRARGRRKPAKDY